MPSIVECCVLIPCSNVEDFPSQLAQPDARSLLGCLTAAWHPRLIAATQRVPGWHRGDDSLPPTRQGADAIRLILVPEPCQSMLPSPIAEQIQDQLVYVVPSGSGETDQPLAETDMPATDVYVCGPSRGSILETIDALGEHGLDGFESLQLSVTDAEPLRVVGDDETIVRTVGPSDFHALGYAWWQVQVLTRRLRYTSNLDQLHFENCVVEAANGFAAADALACAAGLHDAFDALAEERDHYFASDPSLIDLTLLTPSTVPRFLDNVASPPGTASDDSVLPTPQNVLIDAAVGESLLNAPENSAAMRSLLTRGDWGWAGGGPAPDASLDGASIAAREDELARSMQTVHEAVGAFPSVHARLGGATPASAIPALTGAGCVGVIPIDFIAGRGFGDESKVILGTGKCEMEALTAKPIDAANDASFLTLGTRLGEAIDGGEIATGLLVHWPGEGCESFHDVRLAASWTLTLGKFWKLEDYFTLGEHPYHHGHLSSVMAAASDGSPDVSIAQAQLDDGAGRQWCRQLAAMRVLVQTKPDDASMDNGKTPNEIARQLAAALGFKPSASTHGPSSNSQLAICPTAPAARHRVQISGKPAGRGREVFAAMSDERKTDLILDVPAFGFGWVSSSAKPSVSKSSADSPATADRSPRGRRWIAELARSLVRRPRPIVAAPSRSIPDGHLSNEFMDAMIDRDHGGINGVYSGRGRGNRFSCRWRIGDQETKSAQWTVLENDRLRGVVQLSGPCWQLQYELPAGSRVLRCRVRCRATSEAAEVRLKTATADATPIVRAIFGEQVFRTSARSFAAPLGYMIDEDERTTLIATHGAGQHRRVGERFIETTACLSMDGEASAADEWTDWWTVDIGFDLPEPLSVAGSVSVPTQTVAVDDEGLSSLPGRGWLIHSSPRTLTVQAVDAKVFGDGTRVVHLRLIATRSKATTARVRFCRRVSSAQMIAPLSRPIESDEQGSAPESTVRKFRESVTGIDGDVVCHDDAIELSMGGHAVSHVLVFFDEEVAATDSAIDAPTEGN